MYSNYFGTVDKWLHKRGGLSTGVVVMWGSTVFNSQDFYNNSSFTNLQKFTFPDGVGRPETRNDNGSMLKSSVLLDISGIQVSP